MKESSVTIRLVRAGAAFAAVCLAVLSLRAETVYYVDGTNGRDDYDGKAAVYDGTHGPKRVLQDAIDLFGPGGVGTIRVLPGVYGDDQGYAFASNRNSSTAFWGTGTVRCRAFVADKRLRIESTGGAAKTHIVGKWSDSATGLGDDAIRCLGVGCGPGCVGTVIKGFTLRDGATPDKDNSNDAWGNGGAVGSDRSNRQVYLVDCVISNCVARRGGAIVNATAIRSVFQRCCATGAGNVGYKSDFYASAAFHNGEMIGSQHEALIDCPHVVHCALFANVGGDVRVVGIASCEIYNTVFPNPRLDYSTRNNGTSSMLTVSNCAFRIAAGREVLGESASLVLGNVVNVSASPYVLASPWECDFHPVKGSSVDGAGLASASSPDWVPEEFRGIGFDGRALVVGGLAPIGPVAEAVEMEGGFLEFSSASGEPLAQALGLPMTDPLTNGLHYNLYYLGATSWPRQIRFRARSTAPGAVATRFTQSGVPGVGTAPDRWCDRDNSIALTFPPAGVAFVHAPVWAEHVVYCAPDGRDDNDGLTEQTPKTILGACTNAAANTLVIALPGTYQGDAVEARSIATRATVPIAGTLLRSRDGASATTLRGVFATDDEGKPTYGAGAVRCLNLGDRTCAQGFTLAGGGVLENVNEDRGSGGGVIGYNSRSVLMDSVVTNCYGARGTCRYAWSVRCRYAGNWATEQAVIREGNASSCAFVGNTLPKGSAMTVGSTAYNCTFREDGFGSQVVLRGDGAASAYNCVVSGGNGMGSLSDGYEYVGCYTDGAARPGALAVTVLFAAEDTLRLRSDSPALLGGRAEATYAAKKDGGTNAKADWARFTTDDIEGRLIPFELGRPTAGAWQRAAQVVNVAFAKDGEVSPSGTVVLSDSDALAVSVPASARQYLGYEIDGAFTASDVRSFTVPAPAFPIGTIAARAVFNTNWYVNAGADYSDENDGWTPDTARQSLAEGAKDAAPGDVVHVARGIYNRKKALYSGASQPAGQEPKIHARVVVPKGVTLRGDEGPEEVVIVGEKASDACADYNATYGTGSNAVRCAFLETGARLERVTCANGHSGTSGSSVTGGGYGQDDNYGGGVLGRGHAVSVVSHCIVTNCGGGRAGAVSRVRAEGCYIADNVGSSGALGREAAYVGCVCVNNVGPQPFMDADYMLDSTFIGDATSDPAIGPNVNLIANSVIVCRRDMTFGGYACLLSNTVVCSDYKIVNDKLVTNGLVRLPAASLKLDPRGIPAKDSPLVDWTAGRAPTAYDGFRVATDPFGVPRVLNGGRQDLGGAEYDWRVDYGRDLVPGKGSVTSVSAQAMEEADGRVSLPEGELVLEWPDERSRRLVAEVTGTGTLALYRDGGTEPVHTWTQSSPSGYRMPDAQIASATLRFVYTPGDQDEGAAILGPFCGPAGMALILR